MADERVEFNDDSSIVQCIDGEFAVHITVHEPIHGGFDTKTPSIGIYKNKQLLMLFTWNECREVCDAITKTCNISEFG